MKNLVFDGSHLLHRQAAIQPSPTHSDTPHAQHIYTHTHHYIRIDVNSIRWMISNININVMEKRLLTTTVWMTTIQQDHLHDEQ
jgi:hypothetical protein